MAEGSGPVIIARHIVGHPPAQGDEAGAGRDRQKPAVRDDQIKDFGKQHTGFGTQDAGLVVEGDES